MNKTTTILTALLCLPLAVIGGDSFSDDPKACRGGSLADRAEAFLADPKEMNTDDGFLAYEYCQYCLTYHTCGSQNETQGLGKRERFAHQIKTKTIFSLCYAASRPNLLWPEHQLLEPKFDEKYIKALAICAQE